MTLWDLIKSTKTYERSLDREIRRVRARGGRIPKDLREKRRPTLFVNSQRVGIEEVKIARWRGTRLVLFSAITKDSDSPTARSTQMAFVAPKGVDIAQYAPRMTKDRCLVRSSSPWYRYCFQYANRLHKAQYGRINPFQVKGTGKPINTRMIPGLDKHLLALARGLQQHGLIRS